MPWNFFTNRGVPRTPIIETDVRTGLTFPYLGPMGGVEGTAAQAKTAPPGYLFCNNAEVPKDEFVELYDEIGDRYGTPSDPDNFVLPSSSERFVFGIDISDANMNQAGQTGGDMGHSHTVPDHVHTFLDHEHLLLNHTHLMSHTHFIPNHGHGAGGYETATQTVGQNIRNSTGAVKVSTSPVAHKHNISGTLGTPNTNTSAGPSHGAVGTQPPTSTTPDTTSSATSTGAEDSSGDPLSLTLPEQGDDNIPSYLATTFIIKT